MSNTKVTEIKLIERKYQGPNNEHLYRVTVNGVDEYTTPFSNEVEAKAAAFDEALKAAMRGPIYISYQSF